MWHYIAVMRKMNRHEEKMKKFEQESKQIMVKVKAHDEKIGALAVFDVISKEAASIESNEVAFFKKRLSKVHLEIAEVEKKL